MFQNILVPISSEFYSKDVIKRSIFLAETFNGKVHLLYIIEKKPLDEMERRTDTHLTHYDRTETHNDVLNQQRQTADDLVFEDAQHRLHKKNIDINTTIMQGEFSEVVTDEIEKNQYDLVLMGYGRGCMIDYRLINEIDIPVWIESGGYHESILAVCSNLAPNQRVPELSLLLSKKLDWKLKMIYVTDVEDNVEVDEQGNRSSPKPLHELLFARQEFIEHMQEKGIGVKTVEGSLQKQSIKAARKMKAGLVIIGREQKKRGKLGFPVKKVKQKMAERCKFSLLFIN
ncbi:MAG: universal stress protein [Candidatus Thermoplasmatota archaeon]|nr:universal stress protein [Candidatus Thermoplasmatota archaeon]MBS3802265.1 universal stress protein [Candidatus Thermoplasmatota archaeon]